MNDGRLLHIRSFKRHFYMHRNAIMQIVFITLLWSQENSIKMISSV